MKQLISYRPRLFLLLSACLFLTTKVFAYEDYVVDAAIDRITVIATPIVDAPLYGWDSGGGGWDPITNTFLPPISSEEEVVLNMNEFDVRNLCSASLRAVTSADHEAARHAAALALARQIFAGNWFLGMRWATRTIRITYADNGSELFGFVYVPPIGGPEVIQMIPSGGFVPGSGQPTPRTGSTRCIA